MDGVVSGRDVGNGSGVGAGAGTGVGVGVGVGVGEGLGDGATGRSKYESQTAKAGLAVLSDFLNPACTQYLANSAVSAGVILLNNSS